ncbi:probable sugar phosphate/phosphate translocator At3g17430 [Brassica napus]|uniref:probable sugar phosphate/phosphate translocator At3g17430 n=1 Tax=Brassica napus TaxID=3708 RepID=UPI002078F42D|nr:probable sugar phosphate/phosphate translocator At3g17430 [Brassica napus]
MCGTYKRIICIKHVVWKNCILAHFCCLHSDAQALMPVATFIMAVICGTDKPRCDVFSNMLLVSVGVVISSYGEIHFNIAGTVYQVTGIFAEALRLVLTQVLLQKKGLTLNPINSLYYIPPCRYSLVNTQTTICALMFFWLFLVIGRTGAVTIRVAGVLKDWSEHHWIRNCARWCCHVQLHKGKGREGVSINCRPSPRSNQ